MNVCINRGEHYDIAIRAIAVLAATCRLYNEIPKFRCNVYLTL